MPTFFQNATLVQLDPPRVDSGTLRVKDGLIASVNTAAHAEPNDEIIDCRGCVLLPGLVNGHTHLYSALAAGLPPPPKPPRDFHEILQLIWWRLDRAHTHESVVASGEIGAFEALRCGTTTLIDHHASPHCIDGSLDALERGIARVGCRGVLCFEVTDRNFVGESSQGIDENRRFLDKCQRKPDGQFAGLVGGHASFTMSDASLSSCVELAREFETGVHLHVAEDPVDERLTREQYGRGLMDRFDQCGLLDVPDTIFAHGTHLSAADVAQVNLRSETLSVAHNPRSNMNNGVGYSPVGQFRSPPLLGTDGIGADMWTEASLAQFKSHDAGRPLTKGVSLRMLGEAARFASRRLGVKLGVLEVGAAADLVLTQYLPLTPLNDETLSGHLVYGMSAHHVSDVMIRGTWCLRNGCVTTCDETAARHSASEQAICLVQRMQQLED